MSLSVIGYKNWQNLWKKKGAALWIGGLMAVAGFGAGAMLGQREFINLAVLEKFNPFDGAAFLTWLPAWLRQTMIMLLTVWIGLWLIRYVVKRMIQPRIEPRMRQWSSRLDARATSMRPERRETLRTLITNPINLIALSATTLFGLTHFIGWTNVTILTSALGIAAAPLIRDLLSGFNIVFEDAFDIGERVQIGDAAARLEGIVEGINIRTTSIRASGGELYVVPHGDIRIVRNFSRGDFSTTSLTLKVAATELARTLSYLDDLGQAAVTLLPNLLEPWQVISTSGQIGQHAELTLLVKARFGQTEQVRLGLLALIQERLAEAGIILAD